MGNYRRVHLGAGGGGEDSSYRAYHAFLLLHLGFGSIRLISSNSGQRRRSGNDGNGSKAGTAARTVKEIREVRSSLSGQVEECLKYPKKKDYETS